MRVSEWRRNDIALTSVRHDDVFIMTSILTFRQTSCARWVVRILDYY